MADLSDPKWGLLERPVLPTIRHVFRGPRELCNRYIKVAEIVLGKLRNSMSLGDVELATRGIRLPDGTKIRVLRDPSSDILYIDTTETVYAPYQEFPYFDFSFIPKEHYTSPTDDDGRSYLLGAELLPLSDSNPTPKRPMWGYHYTGHPYWKGLPDKVEVYQSRSAILWGNQFYFDAKGRNLVSWWHSPGGDLPIPIVRPNDYIATRGASTFTLDENGYLTAVDPRDGPPVYTPIHTTIRRAVILPNGNSGYTLPEFRFGHFTADYRFNVLSVQMYRNNRKWDQYDYLLGIFETNIPYIAGYSPCKVEIDKVLTWVSDVLLFPIDLFFSETGPVSYMAHFSGKIDGYPTATIDISPAIAAALGFDNAFIDQEVTYPWRFNSTGTEAMWIASVGDRVVGESVDNVQLVFFVFSINPQLAAISVIESTVLRYSIETTTTTSDAVIPPPPDDSGADFSYSLTYVPGDCGAAEPMLDSNNIVWQFGHVTGTIASDDDTRIISDTSSEIPFAYSYDKDDNRIVARLSETTVTTELYSVVTEDGTFERYEKETEEYIEGYYWPRYPKKDISYEVGHDWVECFPVEQPGRYFCVGESIKVTHNPYFRDVRWTYRDRVEGSSQINTVTIVDLVADNGLELRLVEMESVTESSSLEIYEDRNPISTADTDVATISIYHKVTGYGDGCGPDGGGGLVSTTSIDRYERIEAEHGKNRSDSTTKESTIRLLTYLNLTNGLVEYKEFEATYENGMRYDDTAVDYSSRSILNIYRLTDTTSVPPVDTGTIYTTTTLSDSNESNVSTDGDVVFEMTLRSVVFDYIAEEKRELYETTVYSNESSKSIGSASFNIITPANYGNGHAVEDHIFFVGRLRQYLDRYSSFSGMVDISNLETMRYLYSELHEKAYQMYLHDPVVLGAFFDAFDDQFACESGVETNTPERDFLLENLPVTEEHRSLYPIALVRNRARLWGNPPIRVEKIKA